MWLIAESGSTKTDWVLCNDKGNEIKRLQSPGINPYFSDADVLYDELRSAFSGVNTEAVRHLFFYGPGCAEDIMKQKMGAQLQNFFPRAHILVQTDLLAAGMAAFGNEKGIICIFGTGANAGLYNNGAIDFSVPSLGYLFGDEGSGAYMGKVLLTDYMNNNLPKNLRSRFDDKYHITTKEILERAYTKPYPSRFLASFTYFLSENIAHPYCDKLVKGAFDFFFDKLFTHLQKKPDLKIRYVGSVAYIFREQLAQAALNHGLTTDVDNDILAAPMQKLVKAHALFINDKNT